MTSTTETTPRRRTAGAAKARLRARRRAETASDAEEAAIAAALPGDQAWLEAEARADAEAGISEAAAQMQEGPMQEGPMPLHPADATEDAEEEGPRDVSFVAPPEMRKRELIALAVARTGMRKREVKPAIEAALALMGEALASGRELNLVPLGKVKVMRLRKGGRGLVVHTRVRQPEEPENSPPNPLAQAAE